MTPWRYTRQLYNQTPDEESSEINPQLLDITLAASSLSPEWSSESGQPYVSHISLRTIVHKHTWGVRYQEGSMSRLGYRATWEN